MKNIVIWLSKLPVAAWFKPLWKKALKWGVMAAGEELRKAAKAEIAKDGPKAKQTLLDLVGRWKGAVVAHLKGSVIPDGIEDQMIEGLEKAYSQLVSVVNAQEETSAMALAVAVDKAVDQAETFLLFRIDLL